MESKAKLFGHPVHPMLIVLPKGLFIRAGAGSEGNSSIALVLASTKERISTPRAR